MAGRTSSYKESYCNEVIECLAEGHTVTAFAGTIGVAASTVYEWIKSQPAFAEAYARGKAKATLFWERRLIEFAQTGKGNAAAVIFGVKNRAPDEWRDVHKIEHTGEDGGPIKTQEVSAREEIERRIAGIAARNGASADSSRLN